jgi:hypothetical protein
MTDHDDRELLSLLARALAGAEPVPARSSEAARAVFTWRTIDIELLEIGFDSAVDEPAGVRGADATVRVVRFGAGQVEVEIDVVDGAVHGQVLGPLPASVRLERPDGTGSAVMADELGQFSFEGVEGGPVRFRLDGPHLSHVTQWFVI